MPPRIVAGKYRGRTLKSIPGKSVRPISGMIKEALFSKLFRDIPGAVFLDIFAGTGSVGIEALSRGAKSVVFIEKDRRSSGILRENLKITGPEDNCKVIETDFFNYDFEEFTDSFPDIIFAGPPYKENLSNRILDYCGKKCRTGNPLLVIQHHREEEASHPGYKKIDSRKYGISLLDFFLRAD